ncbi:hypothetical protein D9M68_911450 [compost metagenome]
MHRAFVGDTQQLLALRIIQGAVHRQFHRQAIDALAFLAVVAAHADVQVLQRQALLFGVERHGQRLAGAQRGVEQVMRLGCRAFATQLHRDIAVQGMRADLDALKKTFFVADADHADSEAEG